MRADVQPGLGRAFPPGRRCGKAPASASPTALPPSGRKPSDRTGLRRRAPRPRRGCPRNACGASRRRRARSRARRRAEATRRRAIASASFSAPPRRARQVPPRGPQAARDRLLQHRELIVAARVVETTLTLQPASAALRTRCARIGASSRSVAAHEQEAREAVDGAQGQAEAWIRRIVRLVARNRVCRSRDDRRCASRARARGARAGRLPRSSSRAPRGNRGGPRRPPSPRPAASPPQPRARPPSRLRATGPPRASSARAAGPARRCLRTRSGRGPRSRSR